MADYHAGTPQGAYPFFVTAVSLFDSKARFLAPTQHPLGVTYRLSWSPDQGAFWGRLLLHELTLRALRLSSFIRSARGADEAVEAHDA